MKRFLFFALSLSFSLSIYAQDCDCPSAINNDHDGKPYRVFHFSNGKELGICGYAAVERGDTAFTQFSLFQCGDDKAINEWGQTKSCKVNKVKDTLFIKEMLGIPIGQSFSTLWLPFYIHKYYFKDGTIQDAAYYRKDLTRYNKVQIDQVFKEYGILTKNSGENIMHVAKMLFWAHVSGSKEAETYLKGIPDKFGPFDAVLAQEWQDIFTTYEHWKETKIK